MANGGRVLVTGGAGFIGSNLVGSLVDGGFEVRVLKDRSCRIGSSLMAFPNVKFVRGRGGMAGAEPTFPTAGWAGHPLR